MSTSLPSPQDAISDDGFFKVDDAELGQRVQQMDEDAVPLATERGLSFYNTNVLQHAKLRPILESLFDRSSLGVYRYFGPAGAIYSFDSDPHSKMEILIVMLWSKGSQVCFWSGSHRHWLDPAEAANSLLQVPQARLQRLSLEPKEQSLNHGGFTVHDARVAFQIREGTAIGLAFGTKPVVETWRPMELPRSLQRIVDEVRSPTIGINVSYMAETEQRAD